MVRVELLSASNALATCLGFQYSTEPPRIVGVKNFTFSDAALQHTAVIECAIENRTTTASVQWIRTNTIITPSAKYRTDVVKKRHGSLIFALSVRDLSESDIGEYLCRLSSEHNDTEGSATAFIHSPSPTQLPGIVSILMYCGESSLFYVPVYRRNPRRDSARFAFVFLI